MPSTVLAAAVLWKRGYWLEQGAHFSSSVGLSSSEPPEESFIGLGQAYGETGEPKASGATFLGEM